MQSCIGLTGQLPWNLTSEIKMLHFELRDLEIVRCLRNQKASYLSILSTLNSEYTHTNLMVLLCYYTAHALLCSEIQTVPTTNYSLHKHYCKWYSTDRYSDHGR